MNPDPKRSAHAHDLTLSDLERKSLWTYSPVRPVTVYKPGRRRLAILLSRGLCALHQQWMADDLFDQIGLRHLFGMTKCQRPPPISNDGDPIREVEHFVQIVRNEEHTGALSL